MTANTREIKMVPRFAANQSSMKIAPFKKDGGRLSGLELGGFLIRLEEHVDDADKQGDGHDEAEGIIRGLTGQLRSASLYASEPISPE